MFIILTIVQVATYKKQKKSIHMTKIPRTKFHVVNFNDVALSLAFVGCDSNSSVENLQPMNESP
jgi:hypothetical protein